MEDDMTTLTQADLKSEECRRTHAPSTAARSTLSSYREKNNVLPRSSRSPSRPSATSEFCSFWRTTRVLEENGTKVFGVSVVTRLRKRRSGQRRVPHRTFCPTSGARSAKVRRAARRHYFTKRAYFLIDKQGNLGVEVGRDDSVTAARTPSSSTRFGNSPERDPILETTVVTPAVSRLLGVGGRDPVAPFTPSPPGSSPRSSPAMVPYGALIDDRATRSAIFGSSLPQRHP